MQKVLAKFGRPALWSSAALASIVLLIAASCSPAAEPAPPTPPSESRHVHSNHSPAADTAPADALVINLPIANRKTALTRDDLRVSQGDTVRLSVTADEPGEIHLHGYNLIAAVAPEHPGELVFDADTAGAFGINFHVFAADTMAYDAHNAGEKGPDDHNGHGAMSHEPIELPPGIGVDLSAHVEDSGGVNVYIRSEGWSWAPEKVNASHKAVAYNAVEGHAHIYVDGVKVNRVYGPAYHLAGLEPGEHHIRVTLNANSHNPLLSDGKPVESTAVLNIPEADSSPPSEPAAKLPAVNTAAPMSVQVTVSPDPQGGYNLRAAPSGFAFAPTSVNGDHFTGQGHAYVAIDGEPHARLYTDWLKLPALPPGDHTITVTLASNQRNPYTWNGSLVQDSVTLTVPTDGGDDGHEHKHGGDNAREVIAEVHLGNLEVYP